MARVIDKTILSRTAPKFTGVVWAYPLEDSDAVELRIFNNGEWVPISGSDSSSSSESNIEGSGCNCSTEEPILLTGDTNLRILAARKVIEDEGYDISNVVDADLELWIANLPEEEAQRIIGILASRGEDIINSLSLTTENHGRVVQVGGNNYNKFLCEDGFILEIVNDDLVEFPPHTRYYFDANSQQVYDRLTSDPVESSTIHNITDVIYLEGQSNNPNAFFHLDIVGQGFSLWYNISSGWNDDDTRNANIAELEIIYGGDMDSASINYIPLATRVTFPGLS